MNFTLHEYFYKLYNKNMLMMLLPIGEFLGIYFLLLKGIWSPVIDDALAVQVLLAALPLCALAILTTVQLEIKKRLKKMANEPSLGKRLDLYLPMTKRNTSAVVWSSLLLAIGFFLTAHEWFSIFFGVMILWSWWQWPSPGKVCRDLKLKGDERQMVMTKGDAFKN